jgi:hypothetical protein
MVALLGLHTRGIAVRIEYFEAVSNFFLISENDEIQKARLLYSLARHEYHLIALVAPQTEMSKHIA